MNIQSSPNQDFVVRFWKHDKEDLEQDANLLEYLGIKEEKKEVLNRRSKSKTTINKQDTSLHDKALLEERDNIEQSPKKLIEVKSEGRFGSIKKSRYTTKILQNDNEYPEEPISPLLRGNTRFGCTPEPTRNLDAKYIPLINNQQTESKPPRHMSKKPSFNVGMQFHEPLVGVQFHEPLPIEGSIETNSSIKIADLLSDPKRKSNKKSTLPLIGNGHTRTQSYNQASIPLNQFVDQDFNEIGENITNNRGSRSPSKHNIPFQSPSRMSGVLSPKHWNETISNNQNNISPNPNNEGFYKPYEGPGSRIMEENMALSYPTGQMNVPFFPGSEGVLKSLIKLPRLNHRVVQNDNSPGLQSPGLHNMSPSIRLYRDSSNSPAKVERKLNRYGSLAVLNNPPEGNVFRMSAVRQLGEYL